MIIAHRPSILNFVDKVLVMRDGAVADFGTSQEILQKYAAAVQNNKPAFVGNNGGQRTA